MFETKLLPELATDYTIDRQFIYPFSLLANQNTGCRRSSDWSGENAPLLPHWPAWIVMISLEMERPAVSLWPITIEFIYSPPPTLASYVGIMSNCVRIIGLGRFKADV